MRHPACTTPEPAPSSLPPEARLLNLKQLAHLLGCSYAYVRAAKRAGLPLYGGRTCAQDFIAWVRANPLFTCGQRQPRQL